MASSIERFRVAERRVWDEAGVTPEDRTVRLPTGERLRVQESGAGTPILFVHGASNAGTSWAQLIAGLQDFRCIALDRPGCGLSEPMHAGRALRTMRAFDEFASSLVTDVLDALDLPTAHVVATSFGGYFAFRGAAAHSERFRTLVEFSWSVGAPMAKTPLALRVVGVPGVGALTARIPPTRGAVRVVLRQIGLQGALESGRFTDDMLDWFCAVLRDTDTMRNERRSSPSPVAAIRGLNRQMLLTAADRARVTCPVQFVWGTDDPNGGGDIAQDFAAAFPDAALELLPHAGHAPWIDEPERCVELTKAFLAR